MTNGEKIQTILDVNRDCTEVHGENGTMTFTVTQDFWNAEYQELSNSEKPNKSEIPTGSTTDAPENNVGSIEPTTKNDLPRCQCTDTEITKSFIADVEAVKDQLPCGEQMDFPNTFNEFVKDYGFRDKQEVYTNGSELIQVFRVKQWLEHISTTKDDLGVDCISREQAIRELKESAEHHANDSREEALLRRDRDIIRALPSVTPQEPRIITCKDCKYYRNKGNKRSYCTKRLNVDSVTDRYREPNFYCADAVLREVEE